MAQVKVVIGGRSYDLACHTGEEDHIAMLASRVDTKAQEASQAMGGMNEVRQLLFAALLLADEIQQKPKIVTAAEETDQSAIAGAIDQMAARLEILADRLEKACSAS